MVDLTYNIESRQLTGRVDGNSISAQAGSGGARVQKTKALRTGGLPTIPWRPMSVGLVAKVPTILVRYRAVYTPCNCTNPARTGFDSFRIKVMQCMAAPGLRFMAVEKPAVTGASCLPTSIMS